MKKRIYLIRTLVIISIIVGVTSCGTHKSVRSFVKGDGGWVSVAINRNIKYEIAFDDVLSIVTRAFEIDIISSEAGYLRTKWNTTYVRTADGKYEKDYRVRITIRASKERMRVDIKAEAEKLKKGYWENGWDTILLETMRKDIAGVVGM